MPLPTPAKLSLGGLLAVLMAGSAYSYSHRDSENASQSTDAAYVTADFTLVAPMVAGNAVEVLVHDHQAVRKGQLLVRIDERDYVAAVAMAKADLDRARAEVSRLHALLVQQRSAIARACAALAASDAELKLARIKERRYRDLASDGSATLQEHQQAEAEGQTALAHHAAESAALAFARQQVAIFLAQLGEAAAQAVQRKAALEAAQLKLSYTRIVAPIDGIVGQRSVRVGAYAQVGAPLLAVVPVQEAYIEANFRETQLAGMRAGQPVEIAVDMLPGTILKGRVDSLAPASSVSFSPVAPDNATGNFTKVVQRLPVKIVLEPGQKAAQLLKVGMSVTPTVFVRGGAPG